MTPYLEFFISSCQIKTSPKGHAHYGIHMNNVILSKVGLLEPLLSHNTNFLYIFFFTKEVEEEGGEKVALQN